MEAENDKPFDENSIFERLANEFANYKKDGIINILRMGKLFTEAKKELEHGKFMNWLKDVRVSMSIRTAQRMMSAYKNFRHLIEPEPKDSNILVELDISHILELKHVPQRFKKSIEVEENGIKTMVDVVDEKKVEDFLNKSVSINNKVKQVKELPLNEFKKQIQEVGGEYKDLKSASIKKGEDKADDSPSVVMTPKQNSEVLIQPILSLISNSNVLIKEMSNFDNVTVYELTQDNKEKLIMEINNLTSILEAIIVKSNDIKSLLE